MFSIDSASIRYLEYTSSIMATTSSTINLSNGGTISASVVSASALYGPSTLTDTYTPSLVSTITGNHTLFAISSSDYPFTSSTANTIYRQYYVPANTIKSGDIIQFNNSYIHSGSATLTLRLYVNSGSSTVGTLIATDTDTAVAGNVDRYFGVRTNNTLVIHSSATDDLPSNFTNALTSLSSTVTIPNLTGSTYWNFAIQANAASTHSVIQSFFRIIRS